MHLVSFCFFGSLLSLLSLLPLPFIPFSPKLEALQRRQEQTHTHTHNIARIVSQKCSLVGRRRNEEKRINKTSIPLSILSFSPPRPCSYPLSQYLFSHLPSNTSSNCSKALIACFLPFRFITHLYARERRTDLHHTATFLSFPPSL